MTDEDKGSRVQKFRRMLFCFPEALEIEETSSELDLLDEKSQALDPQIPGEKLGNFDRTLSLPDVWRMTLPL